MNRILIISTCEQCSYFDNQYYGYHEVCKKLDRKIEKIGNDFIIPDDCPLEQTEDETS